MSIRLQNNSGPYSEKWLDLDRDFQAWYEFGIYPNGNIDVACSKGDIVENIPRPQGLLLIAARKEFFDKCAKIFSELPK